MTLRWLVAAIHLLALAIGMGAVWGRGRALRGELDTVVYTSARREVSLRSDEFSSGVRLVDAILGARRAA